MLKLNVDAASRFDEHKLGIGAVVRNYKGEVIAAFSRPVQGCFRSDEMEAKTLFNSLNWAVQHQLPIAFVETDALRVFSALNSIHTDLSCFSDLINVYAIFYPLSLELLSLMSVGKRIKQSMT